MRQLIVAGMLASLLLQPVAAKPPTSDRMPRTRPGQELPTIGTSIRSMQGILHGQPEPQDLAELAWSSLSQRYRAMVPGTVLAKAANYRDDTRQSFFFSVLSIQSLPTLPMPIGRVTSWKFEAQGNGTWAITPYGVAGMMDRLETELAFWTNPAASFPPLGNVAQARQLFQRLLATDEHPEYIRPQPTMNHGRPVRPDARNPADLIAVVRGWKQGDGPRPQFIGVTASPYGDAVSYIDDGSSLWAVLYRYDHGQPFIADWMQVSAVEMGDGTNVARMRLCTLPVSVPRQAAVGGAGTTLSLTELQSANGQLLVRLFRLLALNNQGEVFSYFAPTITKRDRLQWWQRYAAAASNLSPADIKATLRRDGKIDVVFPSGAGEGQLLCSFPKPNQLRVERLVAGATKPAPAASRQWCVLTGDPESQLVAQFLSDAIVGGKQGDASRWFPNDRLFPGSYLAFLAWTAQLQHPCSGKYTIEDEGVSICTLTESLSASRRRTVTIWVESPRRHLCIYKFDIEQARPAR